MIDIKSIKYKDKKWTLESRKQPCPQCGKNEASNCGYLEYDEWNGDYDCTNDEYEGECDGCPALICNSCRNKKGDFNVKTFS